MNQKALYPGTFDPLTNGHLDLIKRALGIFNHLTVAVANNIQKTPLFSASERMEMIREATRDMSSIEVTSFDGLLINYARAHKINTIIRGLRAVSDFEYELQIASVNRKLSPEIETVFMVPNDKYAYLSSSIVKEVAGLGGCIKGFVPTVVEQRLLEKLKNPY